MNLCKVVVDFIISIKAKVFLILIFFFFSGPAAALPLPTPAPPSLAAALLFPATRRRATHLPPLSFAPPVRRAVVCSLLTRPRTG